MHIWIDADACPGQVKEIIFRTSDRTGLPVTLVANQSIAVPRSELIDCVVVSHGADVADSYIVEHLVSGDLVITADIPLAARVVEKGGTAIDVRGETLDKATIGSRLAMRDLMESMRSSGMETRGPKPFGQKDVQAFANALDRILAKLR
ncbi:MAG: YaiI/YqxD family protein [Planctomycetaceae bacterium]